MHLSGGLWRIRHRRRGVDFAAVRELESFVERVVTDAAGYIHLQQTTTRGGCRGFICWLSAFCTCGRLAWQIRRHPTHRFICSMSYV